MAGILFRKGVHRDRTKWGLVMHEKIVRSSIRRIVIVLMSAAGFCVAVFIQQMVAGFDTIYPANLWLPAGFSLGATIILGPFATIGIFIGSFILRLGALSGPRAPLASAIISLGFSLQSLLGAWRYKKTFKNSSPQTVREAVEAIGITLAVALVSTFAGITGLCATGYLAWETYWEFIGLWWMGSAGGILLVTPIILLAGWVLERKRVKEPSLLLFSSFFLGLGLVWFIALLGIEAQSMNALFIRDAHEMAQAIQNTVSRDVREFEALGVYYSTLPKFTPSEFDTLAKRYLSSGNKSKALLWVPYVERAGLEAYEKSPVRRAGSSFPVFELDSEGRALQAARTRQEYFPIDTIYSDGLPELTPGFDLGSSPECRLAMMRARDEGQPTLSPPIRFPDQEGARASVLVFGPVYHNSIGTTLPGSAEERRSTFRGFIVGLYPSDAWVGDAVSSRFQFDIELQVSDVADDSSPKQVALVPSPLGQSGQSGHEARRLAALSHHLSRSETVHVGDRSWQVTSLPGKNYFEHRSLLEALFGIVMGMIVTVGQLILTGGRLRAEVNAQRSANEFRALADNLHIGVLRAEPSGRLLYANEAAALALGFKSAAALVQGGLEPVIPGNEQLARLIRRLETEIQVNDYELDFKDKSGKVHTLLCSATLFGGVITATISDTTEKIRETRELRQFTHIVDEIADTILVTDVDGIIVYVNKAFESTTGYGKAEVVGKGLGIRRCDSQTPQYYDDLAIRIGRGEIYREELVNQRKNGELYNETVTIAPVRDADGTITNFVATGSDTTERRKSEDALRRSEEKFNLIANGTSDMIYILDIDTAECTYISPSVEKLLGYTVAEMIGRTFEHTLEPETYRSLGVELTRRAGIFMQDPSQSAWTRELTQIRKDAAQVPMEVKVSFVRTGSGKTQLIGISRDISERKGNEAIIREIERRNAALIENAPDGIAILDLDEGIIFASPSAYRIFGETGEAGSGNRRITRKIHPDDFPMLGEKINLALQSPGMVVTAEYRISMIDNLDHWIRASYSRLDIEAGKRQLAINFEDISEQKKKDELLKESKASLESAQRIAKVGSWELDRRSGEIRCSEETLRIFGIEGKSGVIHTSEFLGLIHPEDRNDALELRRNVGRQRGIKDFFHRIIRKDGSIRYVHERFDIVFSQGGRPVSAIGTVQDITEVTLMRNDIEERVKELTCLFQANMLLSRTRLVDPQLLETLSGEVAKAMRFPDLALVRIALDGRCHGSIEPVRVDYGFLASPLRIGDLVRGSIEVRYSEERPFIIPEEQALIDNVAKILCLWIESKEAEEALRESNERFEQLAASVQEAFWMLDFVNNKIEYIGTAYESIWGRSARSLIEDTTLFMKTLIPEDRPILQTVQHHNLDNETTDVEYRILKTDGTIHYVRDRSFPILDGEGKVVRRMGVCTDVTEIKKTQRTLEDLNRELERRVEVRTGELRKSEAFYRGLFESSNDAIFLLSSDGRGVQANQRGLDIIGCSAVEFQEMDAAELKSLLPGEGLDQLSRQFNRLLQGEHFPSYELSFLGKDGTRTDAEFSFSTICEGEGKAIFVQVVVRNISERKRAEERLHESRDQLGLANMALKKASRLKDEFLASMSHELRTPLTGILGLSEALQLETFGDLSERQARALKNIELSGRHLLELINDILDLSKIEAGKLDLQIDYCDAGEISQASLLLAKGMAHQRRQNVGFSIEPASIRFRADKRRLKQMIVNLFSNAIKFTPEGGNLGIEVMGNAEERTLEFCVWDRGIGISKENLGKLFKPFSQIDSGLSRQYSGTGLGLSLVQNMAQLHGGSIKVESELGQGSRFTIVLPWDPSAAEADKNEDQNPDDKLAPYLPLDPGSDVIAEDGRNNGPTVLIVDDNELILETTSSFLISRGYRVAMARSGTELLGMIVIVRPDIILMDIQMPGMDGMEATRRVRAMDNERINKVPIIAITALAMSGDREKCLVAGVNEYVSKPFVLVELDRLIQDFLAGRRT